MTEESKPTAKIGRPSLFTEELFEQIVERLSDGEPLAQICRGAGMPSYRTVWEWQQQDERISKGIAHAREEGEDVIAARLRLIARGQTGSTDDVQRDKLIIDTDLKLLAKWNPKKYGDSTTVKGDKENPLVAPGIPVTHKILGLLTREQLEKIRDEAMEGDEGTNN